MLQDVIDHPPSDQDDVSSPLSAQILEFCDPEFLETFQNSEVTSSSNNCCYEHNNSNLSLHLDLDKFNSCCQDNNGNNNNNSTTTHSTISTTSTTTTAAANPNNINNLSLIFDPQDELDNEISVSIDFSSSPTFSIPQFMTTQQEQFDFYSLQPQLSLTDMVSADGLATQQQYSAAADHNSVAPSMGHPLTSVFEEDCLSSVPSYVPLNPSSPSCSFLGTGINNYMSAAGTLTSADNSGIFGGGSILLGSDLQPQEMEFQGDNGGIFCPDSIPRVFNPGELQGISNENHQFVSGVGNSAATPLASDISSLEDPSFKVGRLSVEQRREKIHRYMKKRNERNFSKKIKYACRKTLADSRPRVRGRFAKNDDFGETHRAACSNHEEDDEDEIVVKEEEHMVDSADIFAHISGVNSFNCNYSIQSWI